MDSLCYGVRVQNVIIFYLTFDKFYRVPSVFFRVGVGESMILKFQRFLSLHLMLK